MVSGEIDTEREDEDRSKVMPIIAVILDIASALAGIPSYVQEQSTFRL